MHVEMQPPTALRLDRSEVRADRPKDSAAKLRGDAISMPFVIREINAQDVLKKERHHELEELCLTRGVGGNHFFHGARRWHLRRVLLEQPPISHCRAVV